MNLRFFVDPETDSYHIYNHRVEESEVYEVFENPGEDRKADNGARKLIGQTKAGRYLRVIYVRDPIPDSYFVITAYDLPAKQIQAYHRRKRKKENG